MEILIRPSRVCGRYRKSSCGVIASQPQAGCGPDINRRVCRTHVPYAFGCNPYPPALILPSGELSPKVTERARRGRTPLSALKIPALKGSLSHKVRERAGVAAPARPHGKLRQCRAQACKKTAPIDIGAAGFPRLNLSSAVWRAAGTAWRQAGLLTDGSAAGARSSRFPSDGLSSLCAASPYTAAVPFRILT